jgi:hypothetical protein
VTVATPKDAQTPAAEAMLAILREAAASYASQRRPPLGGGVTAG